ncbi:unnamed protein product [Dovyalis caffra]|uniref:Pectinesterase n=1 Tax=Dovyalis caffra TaxID=77055 RepID=A0AAV1RW10_9ROSI|nr:unnamed protein product [Dovyalis caffra]
MVLFLFFNPFKAQDGQIIDDVKYGALKTIVVDKNGQGNFTSVQKAIDSIPSNNNFWTLISVKAGIYNEKVKVPRDKPFIVLQGESRWNTVIQWEEAGSSTSSAAFSLEADHFIAAKILFKNTYNLVLPIPDDGHRILWAPAAVIYGDKASFYECGFAGLQDTLTDAGGRHYFKSCYIQGAIDFIWGKGRSFYERCILNATAVPGRTTSGHITAQARDGPNDPSGFVFNLCSIQGNGAVYLGRAYRPYSRVVFKGTFMSNIVQPEGWDAWNEKGKEETEGAGSVFSREGLIGFLFGERHLVEAFFREKVAENFGEKGDFTFAQVDCKGPGSDTSKRVPWEKKLDASQLEKFSKSSFIDQDRWLEKLRKDRKLTTITYNAHEDTDISATFTSSPSNIVAKDITFKNSYNLPFNQKFYNKNIYYGIKIPGVIPALSARIYGDKSAFYDCAFVGVQDTLWDVQGRHHFSNCYIEGAVDFIFGAGQSFYEGCSINVTSAGFITAQGREFPNETNGFIFSRCTISGIRGVRALLGRAFRPYSKVIFQESFLSEVVDPLGWNAWHYAGHEDKFTYAEINCKGPGSNKSKRVPWEKKLSANQLKEFSKSSFIDQDGWLAKLPL